MDRRSFLKSATATGLTVGLYRATANAYIPEHNWDKYDWGAGLSVPDRLYQGPFPQYGPCAVVPESGVWMVTTPRITRRGETRATWLERMAREWSITLGDSQIVIVMRYVNGS